MGEGIDMRRVALIFSLVAFLMLFQGSCSLLVVRKSKVQVPSGPIVIYGDTRTDHVSHQKVVNAIMTIEPAVVFHVGDLVEDGLNPDDWAIFNEIVSELVEVAEFYPALGNHEKNSRLFFDNFDLPNNERWYSVEIDDIHFIVLDSNSDSSEGSEQYEWLEADLQNISDKIKFVMAVFHHPPFSSGPHIEDEKGLRRTIVPLFEEYGVDIVFNGHDHVYERSLYNDVYYIVTGGGGASLYDKVRTTPYSLAFIKAHHFCTLSVSEDQLIVSVFDVDLNLIDQFVISRKKSKNFIFWQEMSLQKVLPWQNHSSSKKSSLSTN
jgi:hypothetical protein